MSLIPGQEIEVTVEKPASGGRMIARHEGQVILVLGTVPGESVVARVERVEKRLAFATVTKVTSPSADRRDGGADPLCGGCLFAHIGYARQVALKAEIIADAFARIGRVPLGRAVPVVPSPERAYRMRARFHVQNGRTGFFREGTHELCDAAATGQLTPAALDAVEACRAALEDGGGSPVSLELSENVAADQRSIHVELRGGAPASADVLRGAAATAGLTGCTARAQDGALVSAGEPIVTDPLALLTSGRARTGTLGRHPASFFQTNRYLLPGLVARVLDAVPAAGEVFDLYAGVGLFSVAMAATGRAGIVAVEGDRMSGADLARNAAPFTGSLRVVVGRVEDALSKGLTSATIVVDPPRTGISRDAMAAIVNSDAARIIYVSCDPPTMARDARRLLDAGYRLESLDGFDLFPNTPHVEVVGSFQKG